MVHSVSEPKGRLTSGMNSLPDQSLEPQVVAKALSLETSKFGQIMTELLPHSLVQPESATYDSSLPEIMEKYCMHPQGPLTNLKFLGFPFH